VRLRPCGGGDMPGEYSGIMAGTMAVRTHEWQHPFGVVQTRGVEIVGLEEKPSKPKSHYAVTGLYFYDGRAPDFAASLKPSSRGELEITDLNRCYLDEGSLQLQRLGRGYAWLDTGTHESLLQASNFIETIEARQGLRVSCPEEIAYFNGWITPAQLRELARPLAKNGYGQYLLGLLEHERIE